MRVGGSIWKGKDEGERKRRRRGTRERETREVLFAGGTIKSRRGLHIIRKASDLPISFSISNVYMFRYLANGFPSSALTRGRLWFQPDLGKHRGWAGRERERKRKKKERKIANVFALYPVGI